MSKARFRGLKKVGMQFLLTAIALNLKKMGKTRDVEEINSRLSRKFTDITQIAKYIFRNFVRKLTIDMFWATNPQGFATFALVTFSIYKTYVIYNNINIVYNIYERILNG